MPHTRTLISGCDFGRRVNWRSIAWVSGFTLVELVTIMIIVGIVAVVALPRMIDHTFDERGFHDATQAALQHARHVAVASRHFVCVTVIAGSGPAAIVALNMDTAAPESPAPVNCTAPIALPSPGRGCAATNQVCAPSGVSLTINAGGSAIFDPLGRWVSAKNVLATALALTVSNQPSIAILPETGYVQ